jgi:hypothetical protein
VRMKTIVYLAAAIAAVGMTAVHADAPPSMVEAVSAEAGSKLTAEWWQWAAGVPGQKNPLNDLTGANCAHGQQGSVWFLAGGIGSSAIHRSCTVPAGEALFFPLINMVSYPNEYSNSENFSCEDAKAKAADNNATAVDLFAIVDGVAISDLKNFRASSTECFDFFARVPKYLQPYSGYPSATDGFWLLLKPLPKGHHVIQFGARYNNSASCDCYGEMVQNIMYDLEVD